MTAKAYALAGAMLACSSTAWAVTLEGVLRIGDSTSAGTVTSVGGVAINQIGGYAVGFQTASTTAILGDATGTSPSVAVQLGVIGGENVTGLLTNALGIANDGTVVWRGDAGTNQLIGLSDGTIVAKEGNAIPSIPGINYNVPNGPAISADGTNVLFRASTTASAGAALFSNSGNTALLIKDDTEVAPGLTVFSAPGGPAVSSSGSNYLSTFQVNSNVNTRNTLAVNGAIPEVSGSQIRQSITVPAAAGGDGTATWNTFSTSTPAINDSGDWLISGTLAGATVSTSNDAFLALNGVIVLREGSALGGGTLTGSPLSGALNNDGNWAAVWAIDSVGSLIVNGLPLLSIGDDVGPFGTLTSFTSTGTNMLQVGPGDSVYDIYFRATTSLGGDGIYKLSVPEPGSLALMGLAAALIASRRRSTATDPQ